MGTVLSNLLFQLPCNYVVVYVCVCRQNILRFVVKYGTVVSFRYLFRTGQERSETRDYVFVEFATREV